MFDALNHETFVHFLQHHWLMGLWLLLAGRFIFGNTVTRCGK